VGTGIRIVGQLTMEAVAVMKLAEKLFYLVADQVAEQVILDLNPSAESLRDLYEDGRSCLATYHAMVDRMLSSVRAGRRTCGAFYGHPGVFAYPCHEAIRKARAEGFEASMLPGISAEDCLFADLGVDPAQHGFQTHEATQFVLQRKPIDPTSALVLWQVGVFGDLAHRRDGQGRGPIALLVERLLEHYPPDHEVTVYEAAVYAGCKPRADRVQLARLGEVALHLASTLYIPPARASEPDPALVALLGMGSSHQDGG
jgi:uncharacterized protein YabN with tetrapyrrole methylase and pyrophosphatase domain